MLKVPETAAIVIPRDACASLILSALCGVISSGMAGSPAQAILNCTESKLEAFTAFKVPSRLDRTNVFAKIPICTKHRLSRLLIELFLHSRQSAQLPPWRA